MTKARLNQIEKSAVPGSLPVTDLNNVLGYMAPGSNGQVLTVINGIPTYVNPVGHFSVAATIAARDTASAGYGVNQTGYIVKVSNDGKVPAQAITFIWDSAAWQDISIDPRYLADLGDVVLTAATVGQVLQFNGTNWVNATLPVIAAENGVQIVGGKVELGGTLTKDTTIDTGNGSFAKWDIDLGSFSQGVDSAAMGNNSNADSNGTAAGDNSHADSTGTAAGAGSHADSNGTANGDFSHADSNGTANGINSHADTNGNAVGAFSHADTSGTANGDNSNASTGGTANGKLSNAAGPGTNAASYAEHAGGTFNTIYVPVSTTAISALDRIESIGNGTDSLHLADARVTLKNGHVAFGINNFEADPDAATVRAKFGTGDLKAVSYVNTRDDSAVTAQINVIYTDAQGKFLSASLDVERKEFFDLPIGAAMFTLAFAVKATKVALVDIFCNGVLVRNDVDIKATAASRTINILVPTVATVGGSDTQDVWCAKYISSAVQPQPAP